MKSLKSRWEWVLPETKIKENVIEYLLDLREIEQKHDFLEPSLSMIPSPSKLYDSKRAAKEILRSIKANERIVIHGDFDSDGICALSILWEFLYRDLAKHLGAKIDVLPYIPSRIEQGYGLTQDSLEDVLNLKAKLLISVDCGVRDEELIKEYMGKGLNFVITDHHQPPEDLSEKLPYPLVHQMYPEYEYPQREICGAAVVFLLIQQIKKEAGMDYEITENTKGLDLVALATVTDIMPLVGVNRIFVKYGLKQISKGDRKGMRYLCLRAGLNFKDISAYHLGYVIGPRINAGGRIGSPLDGVKLFVSQNDKDCQEIANDLENLNFQRQKMTQQTREEASSQVDEKQKAIFALGDDWHEGIIGLVAGKLQEEYYRPTIVATNKGNVVKGSARSIKGFNITNALGEFEKYLLRYGGHELAAGFSAKVETINEFREEFIKYANEQISDEQLVPRMKIDLALESESINKELVDQLSKLEPYGYGNPKPVIFLDNLVIVKQYLMGQDKSHIKLLVKGSGVDLLPLLLFGAGEDSEELVKDAKIDVIGYPDLNIWNGMENIQFNVKEWRYSE